MVDGEFSPNVGKSSNHDTSPFSIADAGGLNCSYASAARAAGICMGIRNLLARIYS
jgi:hypothetical protein